MSLYILDSQSLEFPNPSKALSEPDGLLAVGGDLSPQRLLTAYNQGIFPWFNPGEPFLWWSPDPRTIIELDEFHCSRSLAKLVRQAKFDVTINQAFSTVMAYCANVDRNDQSGTWICDDMLLAYRQLHNMGHAHSIEVWRDGQLCGGLYGIFTQGVFCGESMFQLQSNASKLAMHALVHIMKLWGGKFIDCQIENPHLASLGAKTLCRDSFVNRLQTTWHPTRNDSMWAPRTLENYGRL